MTLDREALADNRKVKGWLLWYAERKRECEQRRDSILYASPGPPDGMPRGTEVSDPTGRKGAKLGDLETDLAWICLVEEVESKLPPKMQIFLRLRREAEYTKTGLRGRPGWVAYVQDHYAKEMAKANNKRPSDYWVEDRTFFAWWDRIVTYAVIRAAKRGILG